MLPAIWRALLSCLLLTSGCQSILGIEDLRGRPDAGTTPDAAAPDAGRPAFTFAVLTVNATVPFHGTNLLDIEIQRAGGFDGEVKVAAMSPPTGLMVEPLTIPPGQISAQLAVSAQDPLAQGDTVSFDLVATADGLPERMASVLDAEITGQPGTFDITFGLDATGYSAISFGADDDGAFFDLDVLGNGNVLAFGWGTGGLGARRFALLRLGVDGRPDPGFNGGALVRSDFESGSSGENAQGYAVGRQVDGRIIGIGWHSAAGNQFLPDIGLMRYSAAGAVGDPEFGNYLAGKSRIDLGGNEEVTDGLVLPDSKIVIVGHSNGQLFIARATATGNLDGAFGGGDGYDIPGIGPLSGAEAVAVDEGGRLVVAGFEDFDGNRDMVVLRYTADGQLDMTFGDRGVVRLGSTAAAEHAMAIVARPNGRIVVAGTTNAGGNVDFSVHQLLEDGKPDLDFGAMGVNEQPISPGDDEPADMALLPDGRLVVVGNSKALGPVVARYSRAGALDVYFGDGGDGVLSPYIGESGSLQAVEVDSKNKVLIAGGNAGGTPGPGTFGIVVRMWM
jgi:uncharacterized delta-60 repeat protein